MVGEGRRRIARGRPTTGDGRSFNQKPKLSETNLQGNEKPGFVARLLTRASQSNRRTGRHSL